MTISARHDGALDKAAERIGAAVRRDGQPNAPGIAAILPLVVRGARLAMANLDSAGDKNLMVDATAFAARPSADPGFIDFDMLAGLPPIRSWSGRTMPARSLWRI